MMPKLNLTKSLFILLTASVIPLLSFADTDKQFWSSLVIKSQLPVENWQWQFALRPRIGDDLSYPDRLLMGPAIGYSISPTFSLWLGYNWTPTFMNFQHNHNFNDEQRTWQQIVYKNNFQDLKITHRLRLTERYIEGVSGETTRLRYLLAFAVPLYQVSELSQIGISASGEYFYNLNGSQSKIKSGHDRNRFFIGPYWKKRNTRWNIGYLYENSESLNRLSDRSIHAASVNLTFSFK